MIAWLAVALAGSLQGEVALDTLTAGSRSVEVASGGQERLSATDVGLRLRGELFEADDRLVIGLDYRGREPVAGTFPNAPTRLLVRADVAWRAEAAEVALGRFTAPSAIWVTLDGARGTLWLQESWLTAFAGRRAIGTSRDVVPLDSFLPVTGLSAGRAVEAYRAEILATLAGDRILLGTPADEGPGAQITEDVLGGSAAARLAITSLERWSFGGELSAANNATYAVGPAEGQLEATIQALSLYDAFAWGAWRPSRGVRLDLDVLHQRALLARGATPVDVPVVDPNFSDLRLRGALGRPDRGWIRPDLRVRLRSGRTEVRGGGGIDAYASEGPGPFLRSRLWLEDVIAGGSGDDVAVGDRVLWQLGGGWEQEQVQIEVGASFVDRSAAPVSSRAADPANPGQPLSSEDLAPFTLEAQNVGFIRAFASGRRLFAGLDVEGNLEDRELRAFVQVGVLGAASW